MKQIDIKIDKNNKEKAIKDIEKSLKVTLVAKKADDTVNGYINIIGDTAEIYLYDYDKEPDFENYTYNGVIYSRGNKITIRKIDSALQQVEILKKKGVL